jgi:hypothetical protein
MSRLGLAPARPAKRVAVSGHANVYQKFVTAAFHTTTPWSTRQALSART